MEKNMLEFHTSINLVDHRLFTLMWIWSSNIFNYMHNFCVDFFFHFGELQVWKKIMKININETQYN